MCLYGVMKVERQLCSSSFSHNPLIMHSHVDITLAYGTLTNLSAAWSAVVVLLIENCCQLKQLK